MFSLLFLAKVAFIIYAVFAVILSVILHLLSRYFKETGSTKAYKFAKTLQLGFIFSLLLGVIIWIDALILEPNWIQIRHVTIKSPHFTKEHEKLRIIQLSDLHIEKFGFREKSLIRLVKRLKPDIILNTGDYINSRPGWPMAMRVVGQLKAKQGHYSIIGNTDYYFGGEVEIVQWLKTAGVIPIVVGNLKIDTGGTPLYLVGLSDKYGSLAQYGHREYVGQAFAGIPLGSPKILMIHDPDHALVDAIPEYKPDLVLAGDTHGGQFGIAFIRRYSDYANRSEHMAGKFMVNGFPLYVNKGIGMKTLNLRFLCRPEITVIHLQHRKL